MRHLWGDIGHLQISNLIGVPERSSNLDMARTLSTALEGNNLEKSSETSNTRARISLRVALIWNLDESWERRRQRLGIFPGRID